MKSRSIILATSAFLACASASLAAPTVIIDPGHGGHDRGGIPGQQVSEKTMALDVAKRLARLLESGGCRVVMTREDDRFVSLGERAAIGNSYRNAIFVSIHFNSSWRGGACGFETFYYSRQAASLAARIQGQIMRCADTENRGVKRRGFYVLRKSRNPAVLVECGFLTNPEEAALARQAAHRQALAAQIAGGILGRRVAPPSLLAARHPVIRSANHGRYIATR